MVSSVYIKPALTAPSCPIIHLMLREWDGYDKPDHTKVACLHKTEAVALVNAGYVRNIDHLDGIDSDGVDASDILVVKSDYRKTHVIHNLHVILEPLSSVRNTAVDWIDPTRSSLTVSKSPWMKYHENYIVEDIG